MSDQNPDADISADDARVDMAVATIKDVLWRLEEACQGRRSLYEAVGYLLEDLIREGICAACINETVESVFTATNADRETHRDDEGSVYH